MGTSNASDFTHLPLPLLTTFLIPVLSKSSATAPHPGKGRVSQALLKAGLKGTGLLRQHGILSLPRTAQADLN